MTTGRDQHAKALRAAIAALARRALTRREVTALLEKRGHPGDVAQRVVDELEARSLLSDRAAAESIAHAQAHRGAASGEIRRRLHQRGVAPDLAAQAAAQATAGRDDDAEALRLARERVRTCSAALAPDAIRRRVFAWLARRGYDEQTCVSAVERAVREIAPE